LSTPLHPEIENPITRIPSPQFSKKEKNSSNPLLENAMPHFPGLHRYFFSRSKWSKVLNQLSDLHEKLKEVKTTNEPCSLVKKADVSST